MAATSSSSGIPSAPSSPSWWGLPRWSAGEEVPEGADMNDEPRARREQRQQQRPPTVPELSLGPALGSQEPPEGSRGGEQQQQLASGGGSFSEMGKKPSLRAKATNESLVGKRTSLASRLSSFAFGPNMSGEEDLSDDEGEVEGGTSCCWAMRMRCGKGKGGICYWCFVLVFVMFTFVFPLFLKWMLTSPLPLDKWNSLYPAFPVLVDTDFITDQTHSKYHVSMSPLPTNRRSCNASCSGNQDSSEATSEVNFWVDMELNAPDFDHTAYPVLLASDDFETWWVASEPTDAYPTPYFQSSDETSAEVYRHVTEECTRPEETVAGQPVDLQDMYSSVPTYLLVCVAWTSDKVEWHHNKTSLTGGDLGVRCDAVGGVCGWPCGGNPTSLDLPGCSGGILDIDSLAGEIAGYKVPGASFQGEVSVKACLDDPGSEGCITSTRSMSEWPCHKCRNETIRGTNQTLLYDSLPPMEVLLKAPPHQEVTSVPRVYILTSPYTEGQGPAGMTGGEWRKLYDPLVHPFPIPEKKFLAEEKAKAEEEKENRRLMVKTKDTQAPPVLDASRHKMHFKPQNKVTMKPRTCFGQRGPMYLVACAANSSTFAGNFALQPGQEVAPPPFNDRCLAVTGRCGYACMEQQSPMLQHCQAGGFIPQAELMDDFKLPTNSGSAVTMFIWTLLFGFAVKIVTYFPGLFIPYTHPKSYSAEQTAKLKYIAVCAPSGGETKACVLRNLVGAISGLPRGCQCNYHVVFADEGHRHPQKIMFRAFVAVLDRIPDCPLVASKPGTVRRTRTREPSLSPSAPLSARSGAGSPISPAATSRCPTNASCTTAGMALTGHKETNLKAFTKMWAEMTRMMRLADCDTAKLAKKAADLKSTASGAEEAKKLQAMIDKMSGVAVLKRLQKDKGWPSSEDSEEVAELEAALEQLRRELVAGEKAYDGTSGSFVSPARPVHLDDCEHHSWCPPAVGGERQKALYTLHYVARAKPDEDSRTLKVQHVARGTWYYKVPQQEEKRALKSWAEWRESAQEFQDGDFQADKYLVPVRTSRGKAGGLNFVENYLFDFTSRSTDSQAHWNPRDPVRFKPALFSIADARHQYQPDFFHETIPFFFTKGTEEVNTKVAFTQCPQYFPEMPDEVDYLDTNNSNFFRLNCMLRNCCGGVSSCGTNGTWLIRDRRAGVKGSDSLWDMSTIEPNRQGFTQLVEYRFFHESCKVEDTASSLDRVVKGKHSQYINRRLSYGMAKDPVDYLAAVQRWAEGGVVLSLQTFMGCGEGIHMIWATFMLFLAFIFSVGCLVYGWGTQALLSFASELFTGGDDLTQWAIDGAGEQASWLCEVVGFPSSHREAWGEIILDTELWIVELAMAVLLLGLITSLSSLLHHCTCCGRRRRQRRTRWPTSMAQWARLAITMDNLTYFLWFWTAFFWVGFNYYTVFAPKSYHFEATGMVLFSWILQVLSWSLVITATSRYRMDQSMAANEVFFLSLTNIWRTTQLFYITAPLTVYSILMGCSDFSRHRVLGVDISYWVGGDRGAVSKSITQWWTLMLIFGMLFSWVCFFTELVPYVDAVSLMIVTFIGMDVMHPCAFLWLGTEKEKLPRKLPSPFKGATGVWFSILLTLYWILLCPAFWRNCMRAIVFHPRTAGFIKWVGPVQHVMFPILTIFMPELGVNQALLLLASVK